MIYLFVLLGLGLVAAWWLWPSLHGRRQPAAVQQPRKSSLRPPVAVAKKVRPASPAPYVSRRSVGSALPQENFRAAPRLLHSPVPLMESPLMESPATSAAPSPRAGRAEWEPDEARNSCAWCATAFSGVRRRHHCRQCGCLVCGPCSRGRQQVATYGRRPVRVCDVCHVSAIAHRRGSTISPAALMAFAKSSPLPTAGQMREEEKEEKKKEDEEDEEALVQMSQSLLAELSASFVEGGEEEEEDEGEEGRSMEDSPVRARRRLFGDDKEWEDVLEHRYHLSSMVEAACALHSDGSWQQVATHDNITIFKKASDEFRVHCTLPPDVRLDVVLTSLLDVEARLAWDVDLDEQRTQCLETFGDKAVLVRQVTHAIGPVAARSWVVLTVRLDRFRVLMASVDGPHEPGLPHATAMPQLLVFRVASDGIVHVEQSVQIALGGWLPMSVVLQGLPKLLISSCQRWLTWVEENCCPTGEEKVERIEM